MRGKRSRESRPAIRIIKIARPKKKRFFGGVQLADNLYPDARKRHDRWHYVRPDGSKKTFSAETVHEANEIAVEANSKRDEFLEAGTTSDTGLTPIGVLLEDHIIHREKYHTSLKASRSWQNRKYAMRVFGREFTISPSRLKRSHIESWWNGLTYNQQKLRHCEFRKMLNY